MEIQVKNLDHLVILAGIVDQIGLVEEIDRRIKPHPQQIITTGQVVKAMILNGLGFVSAPLYLFSEFFVGKATEHLLGEGIKPEHLNDDRMGRALDSLSNQGLTSLFTSIAIFAQLMKQFKQEWNLDSIYVADSALYGAANIQQLGELNWITLVPRSIKTARILAEYKGQQSSERGFRFLKDPLFFTSSVFLNTPRRVAALAMVMGLCLLVYTLGQRQLRQALADVEETIPNQLTKPTSTPTLRWIFQCFQAVHLICFDRQQQISNLNDARLKILRFLGNSCQKYYLIC